MSSSAKTLARLRSSVQRHKATNAELGGKAADTLIAVGTGVAIGFARAKFADPATAEWNIPKTDIDWELVLGLGLGGAGLFGVGGKMISRGLLESGKASFVVLAARKTETAVRESDAKK
jgi:hypothetical protein